jgi:protein O-mannosyl-transferase
MSQKKLKKLRRLEKVTEKVEVKKIRIREIFKKNWKFLLLLCLGIIGLYFNSLSGDFVSDDYATIPQNTEIMSIKAAMSPSFFVNLTKTLTALTFGISNPIAYHVVSLVLYLLICVTAFIFLNLFFSDLVSKIALIIFAVLPVHVEAVSWISGNPYLITSLLVLSELIFLICFIKNRNKKYLVWLGVFILISIFSDRIRGFAFVLLVGLVLISFKEELKIKLNLGKVFLGIILVFGILLVFAWPMINNRIESVNSGINASDSVFYNPLFQYPTAITKYLQLIVVPIDLTLYHTMYTIPVWLNWVIFLIYLVAVVWYFFKDKKMFFALAFVFVATAPSMAPIKVSWLVAERYVFLGSLGISLLIALLVERFWNKKVVVIIVLSLLVGVYAVRVFLRNIDWQTNHNLWVNTCQVSPNSHNAWNNIGDDYDKLAQLESTDEGKLRQFKNAIKGFGQSYIIKQNYADAYHNQANIFYKIGRLDFARQNYEQALSFNANMPQTLKTLVQLDVMEKNVVELDKHLGKLQQLAPNDLEVAYIAAVSYAQIGKTEEAKQITKVLYQQFPNIVEIKNLYNALNSK